MCKRGARHTWRAPLASMDAVLQLSDHACFLFYKGHFARSRAKFDAAIAAAAEQAALACRADCLILAGLRLYSLLPEPCIAEEGTLSREEFDALETRLEEACATLCRRRDAGTLTRGRFSPLEERWFVRFAMMGNECVRTPTLQWSRSLAREGVPSGRHTVDSGTLGFFLYSEVLCKRMDLARMALREIAITQEEALAHWQRAAEDVVAATGLLATMRGRDLVKTLFVVVPKKLRQIADIYAPVAGPAWCAAVAAARRTLEQYCLMSSDQAAARAKSDAEAQAGLRNLDAARAAADAAATLRTCALASCGAREAHAAHFKVCSGCRRAAYCCREHQAADWRAHKAACKAARADNDAN